MPLEYRLLGRTGIRVSVVGIGSLGFLKANSSQDDVSRMLDHARAGGINLVDTAALYGGGRIDQLIGNAIHANRSQWVIISRSAKRDPRDFADSLNQCLKNLRTDAIDIFQLHDVTSPQDYEATLQADGIYEIARQAKRDGKVRFIGISTHADAATVRRIILSGRYDVLTISYNVAWCKRQHQDGEDIARTADELLPLAGMRRMGVTIMKPLGGGVLCTPRPGLDGTEFSLPAVDLLRFCIANPHVSAVTPGVQSIAQVDDAIAAGQTGTQLDDLAKAELIESARAWGHDFCRRCGYCMPCEQGIVIPAAMKILDYFKMGNQNERCRADYARLDPKPTVCTACRKCAERCPYRLPIPEKLKELVKIADRNAEC